MSEYAGLETTHQGEQEGHSSGGNKNGSSKFLNFLVVLTLVVLFSSSIITALLVVGLAYYVLTRKLMMRPAEAGLYLSGIALISAILWWVTGAPSIFTSTLDAAINRPGTYFKHHNLIDLLATLSYPLALIGLFIGSILGFLLVSKIYSDYKRFPEIKYINNHWMSERKFQYRPTLTSRIKKKKLEQKLESGANFVLPGELGKNAPAGIALGIDELKGVVEYFTTSEVCRNVLIIGAPGSGKTVTTESQIRVNAKLGITSIVVNMKSDLDLARKLAKYSGDEGIAFYHFTQKTPHTGRYDNDYNPYGQAFIDPFSNLTNSEKVGLVLDFQEYKQEAQKYKNEVRNTLQVLVNSVEELEEYAKNLKEEDPAQYRIFVEDVEKAGLVWNRGLFRLFHSALVHPEALANNLPAGNETGEKLQRRIFEGKSGTIKESWTTPRGNIETVINSSFGAWIGYPTNGEPFIDLDLITDPESPTAIVLFDFNADSEKETSEYLGKMLTSIITALSAHRRTKQKTSNLIQVFFDEAQSVPLVALNGILEKARQSKIGLQLGQQSLSQITEKNGIEGLKSLMDNTNTIIVLPGMKGTTNAEIISGIAGEVEKTVYEVYANTDLVWWKNFIRWDDVRRYSKREYRTTEPRIPKGELINLRAPNPENNEYYTEAMIIRRTPEYDPKDRCDKLIYNGKKVHVVHPKEVLTKLPATPPEGTLPPAKPHTLPPLEDEAQPVTPTTIEESETKPAEEPKIAPAKPEIRQPKKPGTTPKRQEPQQAQETVEPEPVKPHKVPAPQTVKKPGTVRQAPKITVQQPAIVAETKVAGDTKPEPEVPANPRANKNKPQALPPRERPKPKPRTRHGVIAQSVQDRFNVTNEEPTDGD